MCFAGIKEKQAKKRAKRVGNQNMIRGTASPRRRESFTEAKTKTKEARMPRVRRGEEDLLLGEEDLLLGEVEVKEVYFDCRHLSSPRQRALRLGEECQVGTKMTSFSTPFWSFSNTINTTLVIF